MALFSVNWIAVDDQYGGTLQHFSVALRTFCVCLGLRSLSCYGFQGNMSSFTALRLHFEESNTYVLQNTHWHFLVNYSFNPPGIMHKFRHHWVFNYKMLNLVWGEEKKKHLLHHSLNTVTLMYKYIYMKGAGAGEHCGNHGNSTFPSILKQEILSGARLSSRVKNGPVSVWITSLQWHMKLRSVKLFDKLTTC